MKYKKIIVALLIFALTLNNLGIFARGLISYAADIAQEAKTNVDNVEFSVYMKSDSNQEVYTKEEKMDSEDTKLYLRVSVKNNGYFNGEVSIEDANFSLSGNYVGDAVNKIEGNKITLNQLNAGDTKEIELGIIPVRDDDFNVNLVNYISKVRLTGNYKDANAEDNPVDSTKEVQVIYVNPYEENQGVLLSASLQTNYIYNIEGTNKRIAQILINSGLEGNKYPIKETKIELTVPENAESVEVISLRTNATNGKKETEFSDSDWEYVKEENKLTIDVTNTPDQENKVVWNKQGKDQFIVTYIYEDDVEVTDEILIKSQIALYDEAQTIKDVQNTLTIEGQRDGIYDVNSVDTESSIYKGKIYFQEEREISSITNIYVNSVDTKKDIKLEEKQANYVDENTQVMSANIEYRKTIFDKENLDRILGDNGILKIYNGSNEIAKITSQTEANEYGKIEVSYNEGIKEIRIEVTNLQNTGIIVIEHQKVIKPETYDIDVLKKLTEIKREVNLLDTEISRESVIRLEETKTQASFEIEKDSLSTMVVNKDVKMNITLDTSSDSKELFERPVIKVELPSEVTSVEVTSADMAYEDELQLNYDDVKVDDAENGNKVIVIPITGTQTAHKEDVRQGATILLNTNITVDKESKSGTSSIKMYYSNEAAVNEFEGYVQKDIEIIAPSGVMAISKINEYGIETLGELGNEGNLRTQKLDFTNDAKTASVDMQIINNEETMISNVNIVGRFPTDGKVIVDGNEKTNNMGVKVLDTIKLSGMDASNIKIYYTSNADATEDVTDDNNGWSETLTNGLEVKKYLINVPSMEVGASLNMSYQIEVPAVEDYNRDAYSYYEVYYNNLTRSIKSSSATPVLLSTGVGAELTTTLTATVGDTQLDNNAEVKVGEVIKYQVSVENTGSVNAENVTITVPVPEGTVALNLKDESVRKYYFTEYYAETEDTELAFQVDTIEPGQTVTKTYEVRVKSDTAENAQITSKATVTSGELNKESNEIVNIVKSANVRVTIKNMNIYEGPYCINDAVAFVIIIENLTNETQTNLNVDFNGVDFGVDDLLVKTFKYDPENGNEKSSYVLTDEEQLESATSVTIDSIAVGEIKTISVDTIINDFDGVVKQSNISALVNSSIRSNMLVEEINNYDISMTASATNQGGYINSSDVVEYTINVTNNSKVDVSDLDIRQTIPGYFDVVSVTRDGEEVENLFGNEISINFDMEKNSETTFKVVAKVQNDSSRTDDIKVSTVVYLDMFKNNILSSDEIIHIILKEATTDPDNPDPDNPNPDNPDPDNPDNPDDTKEKYIISGMAWLDDNKNGAKDSDENYLEGIEVKLIDIATNTFVRNEFGVDLMQKTGSDGFYIFENVPEGNYIVVFNYDTTEYRLTEYNKKGVDSNLKSSAFSKKMNINNTEGTYTITDTIVLNDNVANVNIGLINKESFDLKLDKYVSKITVQTPSNTEVTNYDNASLAKKEIAAKDINKATIIVEYSIVVTNNGEAEGYAKKIVDYVSKDYKFSSELNSDWYQSGEYLYNSSLATSKLEPGESRTLKLVLTKTMNEENTGVIYNKAEIAESYSEDADKDLNNSNEMSSADVVISIKTGVAVMYVVLSIVICSMIAIGAYFINKKVLKM